VSSEARPRADDEYVTIQQAADLLGVSRFRMARIIKDQQLPVFERAVDKRIKWLRRSDVDGLLEPRPKSEVAA
jgi:hypothetical protein